MNLRLRLALTILTTSVLLLLGLTLLHRELEQRAAVEGLRAFVIARMESGGREQCESRPETFGGPVLGSWYAERRRDRRRRMGRPWRPPHASGRSPDSRRPRRFRRTRLRGISVWAYDARCVSSNPAAPAFPAGLEAAMESGADVASSCFSSEGRPGLRVAVRMAWKEGPCAIVVVSRILREDSSEVGNLLWSAVALCGVLLLAVLWVAGPMVRRIRQLTDEVRRSASERYQTAVEVSGRDEISRLAEAFNEAGGEIRSHIGSLEQREKTLRSFVGNTTHDVMLPLTVLQGHLALLRRQSDAGEGIDPELIVSALEETHYLASLVHNLSAAAKLEAGEPHIRRDPVELSDLVERAVARHKPMAAAREIGLDYSVPEKALRVVGDVTLIEQAVSNVIHNAVRHNEPGGHVAVLLEEEGEGGFVLRNIDDGPGVTPEELSRMTELNFRGDRARSRSPEGLGLGLHIAKDVAERHGFELTFAESEYGGLQVEFRGALAEA